MTVNHTNCIGHVSVLEKEYKELWKSLLWYLVTNWTWLSHLVSAGLFFCLQACARLGVLNSQFAHSVGVEIWGLWQALFLMGISVFIGLSSSIFKVFIVHWPNRILFVSCLGFETSMYQKFQHKWVYPIRGTIWQLWDSWFLAVIVCFYIWFCITAEAAFIICCHVAENLQGCIAQNGTRPEFTTRSGWVSYQVVIDWPRSGSVQVRALFSWTWTSTIGFGPADWWTWIQ